MAEDTENREKIRDKRLDNLIPFTKGKSGNENGRPLGQKNYATLYREALIKLAKANNKDEAELELEILSKGILKAREGDYRFYKDLLDRVHGTATIRTDITSKGESIVNDHALDEITQKINAIYKGSGLASHGEATSAVDSEVQNQK